MNLEGLVLESRYPQLERYIKSGATQEYRDGLPVTGRKHLKLEFDRFICEVNQMAEEQEWTDEDKEFAAREIERELKNPTTRDIWVHEKPKINPPWPNYNETHHNSIAGVAKATGLVGEAITYESRGREGGPRESVIKQLEALQGDSSDAVVPTEDDDLVAA